METKADMGQQNIRRMESSHQIRYVQYDNHAQVSAPDNQTAECKQQHRLI